MSASREIGSPLTGPARPAAIHPRWELGLVVAFCTALYLSCLQGEFVLDDVLCIVKNTAVTGPFSAHRIWTSDFWGYPLFGEGPGTFRPLATLGYWVQWHLSGGKPWLFHVVSFSLHAGLLVAIDCFLSRFADESTLPRRLRLLVVAAFGALTIHVDVVPNATGQAELLASLFSIAALHLAISRSKWSGWLFPLPLLAALLTKESALPLGVFAAYLALRFRGTGETSVSPGTPKAPDSLGAPEGPGRLRAYAVALSSLVVLTAVFFLRRSKQPLTLDWKSVYLDNPMVRMPIGARLRGATEVMTRYFEHAAAPFDLCPDYSYGTYWPTPGSTPRLLIGLVLCLSLVVSFFAFYRKGPRIADAILGFAASYAVVSHFILPASALVADRLFFFPSLWLILAVVLAARRILRKSPRVLVRSAIAFAVATVVFQSSLTAIAATFWQDGLRLSQEVVSSCPQNLKMRMYRARIFESKKFPLEAAWTLLVAAAMSQQWPVPFPKKAFPVSWETLPVDQRLEKLRKRLGGEVGLRRAMAEAKKIARDNKMLLAEQALLGIERQQGLELPDAAADGIPAAGAP